MLRELEWNGRNSLRYTIQVGPADYESEEDFSYLARTCDNPEEAFEYANEVIEDDEDNELEVLVYDTEKDEYISQEEI